MSDARVPYDACPLCESPRFERCHTGDCAAHPRYDVRIPREIHWQHCADCDHVFTEGYFTDEVAAAIFATANPGQVFGQDLERQRNHSAAMVDKVLAFTHEGRWLDVGFGNGSLLFTAQEYGFEPVGIDLRAANVAALAATGIEGHCQDITTFALADSFAVISLADVLEHMPFPKRGLEAARRLLAPGGVLFVSMPNSEHQLWREWDATGTNPYWGELEHYHNFSRGRLYALLRETGFDPVRYGISLRYRACMEVLARKT